MGVLDDAIREHLELKRKHGANEADLARQETEALGPARRYAPAEPAAGEALEDRPVDELPPPAGEPVSTPAEPAAAPYDDQSEFADEVPVDERLDEPPIEETILAEAAERPPVEPELAEPPAADPDLAEPPAAEPEPEPETQALDPADAPTVARPIEEGPGPGVTDTTAVDEATDVEAPPGLDEGPLTEEPGVGEPPLTDEYEAPPADEPPSTDEYSAPPEESPPPGGPTPDPGAPGEGGDDLLEETPDFLQDTPEHDKLWFEQKPPRDFDLDD